MMGDDRSSGKNGPQCCRIIRHVTRRSRPLAPASMWRLPYLAVGGTLPNHQGPLAQKPPPGQDRQRCAAPTPRYRTAPLQVQHEGISIHHHPPPPEGSTLALLKATPRMDSQRPRLTTAPRSKMDAQAVDAVHCRVVTAVNDNPRARSRNPVTLTAGRRSGWCGCRRQPLGPRPTRSRGPPEERSTVVPVAHARPISPATRSSSSSRL
jgi:hypothetical protein